MSSNIKDEYTIYLIQSWKINIIRYIRDFKEKKSIDKIKYNNEREIKQMWESFRKTLIEIFRDNDLGSNRLGLIHFINEEVRNVYQSEQLEYLAINGGYGSFWGCKKNPFNHCK